jgi:uncharacterized membrane protein YfcA
MNTLDRTIDVRLADTPCERPVRPARSLLRIQLPIIAIVWLLWAIVGGGQAFEAVRRNWTITVTMVFGSLVGGGTSEGGGAVAFPVFTKLLHIPATDARIFTYLIQSVGMTAASLCIYFLRVPIESRVVLIGAPAGVLGVVLSSTLWAPLLPMPTIRVFFTVLLTSLAIALVVHRLRRSNGRNRGIPSFGPREATIVATAGFLGGVVSGLVGVGENTIMFIALVLLFRVSEKISTPTTVVMMTLVSIAAGASHLLIIRDVSATVIGYWLAAVPVAVVSAPIGALICSRMPRQAIANTLIALIAVELVSTLLLVPMPAATLTSAAGVLVAATAVCLWFTTVHRYDPVEVPAKT